MGFVSDHVEILYDIDVLFHEYGKARGVKVRRSESLNDSPKFAAALASLVTARIETDDKLVQRLQKRVAKRDYPTLSPEFIGTFREFVSALCHDTPKARRIAVIGGGTSGLAAAYTLARARQAGAPIEEMLIEASPWLGGVVRTETVDGFVIEAGP